MIWPSQGRNEEEKHRFKEIKQFDDDEEDISQNEYFEEKNIDSEKLGAETKSHYLNEDCSP